MARRTGKIARLPEDIRSEANRRALNGATGREVIAWLNSLPEVQTRLRESFGSRPIIHQNWSDWYHGGYRDWLATQNKCATDGTTVLSIGLQIVKAINRLSLAVEKAAGLRKLGSHSPKTAPSFLQMQAASETLCKRQS